MAKFEAKLQVIVAITVLALASCAGSHPTRSNPLNTADWTTHCFGRFLIDLPRDAQVSQSYELRRTPIKPVQGMAVADIASTLAARAEELKATPHRTQGRMFIRSAIFDGGGGGVLSWSLPYSIAAMRLEAYLTAQGSSVVYAHNPRVAPDMQETAVRLVGELGRNLHSLASGELPPNGRQVFCIDGAYVQGNEFRSESMNITVRLTEHPGMVFTLFSTTQGELEPTLLKRMDGDGVGKLLSMFSGMDVLRKGQRDVNGLDAEEHLVAASEKGLRGYAFNWEAQGRAQSVAAPLLSADLAVMPSGADAPPAFTSDAEALKLWDALINSIRPLPGSRDAPPPAPREPPLSSESFEQREFNRQAMDHFIATGQWLTPPKENGQL